MRQNKFNRYQIRVLYKKGSNRLIQKKNQVKVKLK